MPDTFTCHDCHETKPVQTAGGTGYATLRDPADAKICYACCGERDRREMIATGRATLYLTVKKQETRGMGLSVTYSRLGVVSNWPGTLKIPCGHVHVGRHNIARVRYDVWFTGPDGAKWHGVQYGDNTQIVRCRRLAAKR